MLGIQTMDRFKKFIKEDYYRLDPKGAPKTFSKDHSHGVDDDKKEIKGVYATGIKHSIGHIYAVPRDTPRVYHEHEDGTKTLYMHHKHKDAVENHTAVLSTFSKKKNKFKEHDDSDQENVSTRDETPTSQKEVKGAEHIRKQGIKIKYVSHKELKSKASEADNSKTASGINLSNSGKENM